MQAAQGSSPASSQKDADKKIMADLTTLIEKMDLCDTMLHPGDGSPAPSLKNNETLLAVIGFLEACAPRMVELVEAAAQGVLGEETLVKCLEVNDRLQKQLADIETASLTETAATTTAASAPDQVEKEFEDLLLDDTPNEKAQTAAPADPFAGNTDILTPVPMGKSTGEDDAEDSKPSAAPAVVEDSKKGSAAPTPAKTDDFDSFFEERTSSKVSD